MDTGLFVGNFYYGIGEESVLTALEAAAADHLHPDPAPTFFGTLAQRPLAGDEVAQARDELERVRAALAAQPAAPEPVRGGGPDEVEFDEGPPGDLAESFLTRDGRRLLPLLERALRDALEEGDAVELVRG